MIQDALNGIADSTDHQKGRVLYRLAGRLRAAFEYGQIDEIVSDGLSVYLANVAIRN